MISKESIRLFLIAPFVSSVITLIFSLATFVYLIIQNYIGFDKDSYSLAVCSSSYLNAKYSFFKQMLSFQFLASLLSLCLTIGIFVLQLLLFLAYRKLQSDKQIMHAYTTKKLIALNILLLVNLLMVQLIFSSNITFSIQRKSCQSKTYLSFALLAIISGIHLLLNIAVLILLILLANKFAQASQDNTSQRQNQLQSYRRNYFNNTASEMKKDLLRQAYPTNIYDNKKDQIQTPNLKKKGQNQNNILNLKDKDAWKLEQQSQIQEYQEYNNQDYDWPVKPKKVTTPNLDNLYVKQNIYQKNPNFQSVHRIKLSSNVMNVSNKQNLSQQKSDNNLQSNQTFNEINQLKQNSIKVNQQKPQNSSSFLKVQTVQNNQRKRSQTSEQLDSIFQSGINPNQKQILINNEFKQEEIYINIAPNSNLKLLAQQKKNFQSVDDQGRYFFIDKSKIKIRNNSKVNLNAQMQEEKTIFMAYKRKETFVKPKRTPNSNKWRLKPSDQISLQNSIYDVQSSQQYSYESMGQSYSLQDQNSQSKQSKQDSIEQKNSEDKGKTEEASNILNIKNKEQSKISTSEIKQQKQPKKIKKQPFQKLHLHLVPKKEIELKLRLFDAQDYLSVDSYKSVLNGKQMQGVEEVDSHRDKTSMLSKLKNDERYLIRSKDPNDFQFQLMRTIKNKHSGREG